MTPQAVKKFIKPPIKLLPLQATNYIIVTADKGGVGKTATAVNLAGWLAKLNHKVLVIDLDTRGDVATSFNLQPESGIYDVYIREQKPDQVIRPTRYPNLSILPGNHWTGDVVAILDRRPEVDRIVALTKQLAEGYDFVIFDAPDKLGMLRQRAFEMSNIVVIPQKPEPKGQPQVKQILDLLREDQVGILLPTMIKRINIHGSTIRRMVKNWPASLIWNDGDVSDPGDPANILAIPDSKYVVEAESLKKTLAEYAPDSPPAKSYLQLAKRILVTCRYEGVTNGEKVVEV